MEKFNIWWVQFRIRQIKKNNNNINYLLFDNFKEAYKYIFKISLEKEVYLLIENDLPDSFLERW